MNQHAPGFLHRHRHALLWVVKIVVSGGLLYRLLSQVDRTQLWNIGRTASIPWLLLALVLYLVMVFVSCWRWRLLLAAQHVPLPFGMLTNSFLVATFFNNFLPSNIGGDVIRIRDTARAAGSRTIATTVVFVDRGIGLIGLVFVAAIGATMTARLSDRIGPVGPGILWAILAVGVLAAGTAVMMPQSIGIVLKPLRRLHQEWVGKQIERLTVALSKFRDAPQALLNGLIASIAVQGLLVAFYAAIAQALHLHISIAYLGIIVPVSFIVQMLPISVNGFGVREQLFSSYFKLLGEPAVDGFALSFMSALLIMLFSVSGAVAYVTRRREHPAAPTTAQATTEQQF